MTNAPLISVVLCTYNRSTMLRGVLVSLVGQSLQKSMYEIVVVDNGSTDDTIAAVKEFRSTCPTIVLVSEPNQGLGHARNTGCKHAKGRYVAFIDDDCLAVKDWLKTLLDCYEHVKPEPWSVGGVIVPVYNDTKPAWFKDSYETDSWGDQPRFLMRGESFTGCNMSFKKGIIEQYGGFDVGLDMKGDCLCLAGETELYRRIWLAAGTTCTFYYSPRAVIHHVIDPYKMTVAYQLKRALTAGQVSYAMAQVESAFRRSVLFFGSIVMLVWQSIVALTRIRPGRKCPNWAIEELYPVASHCGRLLAFFGVQFT
ncbi:MAG: hypothetical protein C5B60_12005, partial [Chloroflexi bacterium]